MIFNDNESVRRHPLADFGGPAEFAELTHAEVARLLSIDEGRAVSAAAVRQIEQRAFRKLRGILARRGISLNSALP